jgi:Tfp pilus assembly protein PilF
MKSLGIFLFFCLLSLSIDNALYAQDDEARGAMGLPMKIGENATNPNKTNISGKVTLVGFDTSQPIPAIFVSAVVNGATVDRRRATDSGNYYIPGIPRENVIVIVEVNGEEVGRQQLMPSIMGSVRQDFVVNAGQWKNAGAKTGVVSAKNLYPRSEENEKLFDKALSAAKDKKKDTAIKIFKQIIDNDPKDFVSRTELGTLYYLDEKFAEAEKSYTGALEQKPDFILALINLGKLYLAQKQAEKAIPVLTKAVEIEPASADLQQVLGEAYLDIKKGSRAVIYFYEALRLAPIEKAEIHLRLAALYHGAGLKEKAVEEYKQFLQKVPNHPNKEKIEKYIKDNSPQ